jgi:hypothetical protein
MTAAEKRKAETKNGRCLYTSTAFIPTWPGHGRRYIVVWTSGYICTARDDEE